MGKVYRALERSTGQTVAVKSLHKARQSDPRAVAKFMEEARILSRLDHPGIVHLQGVGRFPGGGFFLVLDFVDGADLQRRLERGPLAIDEAVRVLIAAAESVGYAHSQGIVHGDIKPGNVLIAGDHRVVVTDFGLAQLVVDGTRRMAPWRIIGGTAGYMAPEVRLGRATPTPSADVYGLGSLFWALMTGRPPDEEALRSLEGDGTAWKQIVARCLAREPLNRFSSASELVEALRKGAGE